MGITDDWDGENSVITVSDDYQVRVNKLSAATKKALDPLKDHFDLKEPIFSPGAGGFISSYHIRGAIGWIINGTQKAYPNIIITIEHIPTSLKYKYMIYIGEVGKDTVT